MWDVLATIEVGQDWQLTPTIPLDLGYFRLKFESVIDASVWVAQVDPNSPNDIYDERRIVATTANRILEFQTPLCFEDRALALRIPDFPELLKVEIEVSDVPFVASSGESPSSGLNPTQGQFVVGVTFGGQPSEASFYENQGQFFRVGQFVHCSFVTTFNYLPSNRWGTARFDNFPFLDRTFYVNGIGSMRIQASSFAPEKIGQLCCIGVETFVLTEPEIFLQANELATGTRLWGNFSLILPPGN